MKLTALILIWGGLTSSLRADFPWVTEFPLTVRSTTSRSEDAPYFFTGDIKNPYDFDFKDKFQQFFKVSPFRKGHLYLFEIKWEQLAGASCVEPTMNNGTFRSQFAAFLGSDEKLRIFQLTPSTLRGVPGYFVEPKDPNVRFPFTYEYFVSGVHEWRGFELSLDAGNTRSWINEIQATGQKPVPFTSQFDYRTLLTFFQRNSAVAFDFSERRWGQTVSEFCSRILGSSPPPKALRPPKKVPRFGLIEVNSLVQYRTQVRY